MSFYRLSGNTGVRLLGPDMRLKDIVKFGKGYNCVEIKGRVSGVNADSNTMIWEPMAEIVIKKTIDIVVHPMLLSYQVRYPYRLEPGEERYLCFEVSADADVESLPWAFRIYVPKSEGRSRDE